MTRRRPGPPALEAAKVVDAACMAIIGSRVTIREADGTLVVLTLVPPGLALPREGRISPDSPLGEALLGRTAGERARVAAPAGTREITIVAVAWALPRTRSGPGRV